MLHNKSKRQWCRNTPLLIIISSWTVDCCCWLRHYLINQAFSRNNSKNTGYTLILSFMYMYCTVCYLKTFCHTTHINAHTI